MDPTITFILVLAIGIAAGIVSQRIARPSWLSRQIVGGRRAALTSTLVGIAGSFIGFHLAALIILSAGTIVFLLGLLLGLYLASSAAGVLVICLQCGADAYFKQGVRAAANHTFVLTNGQTISIPLQLLWAVVAGLLLLQRVRPALPPS